MTRCITGQKPRESFVEPRIGKETRNGGSEEFPQAGGCCANLGDNVVPAVDHGDEVFQVVAGDIVAFTAVRKGCKLGGEKGLG